MLASLSFTNKRRGIVLIPSKSCACITMVCRIPDNLACIPGVYKIKAEGGNDEDVKAFKRVLYRLTDRSGDLKFKRVKRAGAANTIEKVRLKTGKLFHNSNAADKYSWKSNKTSFTHLDIFLEDVFILDDGFIIWVWIGKGASSAERGQGMAYAMKYLKKFKRPASMPITQVKEGQEPLTFLENLNNDEVSSCTIA